MGVRNSLYGLRIINTRANLLGTTSVIETAALDRYSFTRDAYLHWHGLPSAQFHRPNDSSIHHVIAKELLWAQDMITVRARFSTSAPCGGPSGSPQPS
jgi:ABC-type transporter lipoprotein component MlaA